ncbi:hypothetical protein [Piscinibacter sp.]|jgi:hypothetical protein|uniref:hypothetical protein n=1 Tax=Piscinibacter sp. TaxID=1903157 RepID=UPI00355A7210
MFEPTIPFGEPELMRASAYRLYLKELDAEAARSGVSSRISSLSPSLRADLYRFEADGGASEVLEVVAACVRHAKRVTIHMQYGEHVVPLTVFPHERLVHCPIAMTQLLGDGLTGLRVMHVEPALLRPPGDPELALVGEQRLHSPLAPLLWELAMRGERRELLPEIAGPAVYRVTPGLALGTLPLRGALLSAVYRLRLEASNLRDIAEWPGLDRERAIRLLNALYLQAGLMVSRSHPDAIGDSWFGGLR